MGSDANMADHHPAVNHYYITVLLHAVYKEPHIFITKGAGIHCSSRSFYITKNSKYHRIFLEKTFSGIGPPV